MKLATVRLHPLSLFRSLSEVSVAAQLSFGYILTVFVCRSVRSAKSPLRAPRRWSMNRFCVCSKYVSACSFFVLFCFVLTCCIVTDAEG